MAIVHHQIAWISGDSLSWIDADEGIWIDTFDDAEPPGGGGGTDNAGCVAIVPIDVRTVVVRRCVYQMGCDSMSIATKIKDPAASLIYTADWSKWLGRGEYISSSTWQVEAGMTKNSESFTSSDSSVKVSGGVDGNDYLITCRITTNLGQTDERSIRILVQNR